MSIISVMFSPAILAEAKRRNDAQKKEQEIIAAQYYLSQKKIPSTKEFIAMLSSASPEDRAEIGNLFFPVTKTIKKAVSAEERPPMDLSVRPEMPEDPELDEDFCHGRVYKSFKSDESAAAKFRAAEEAAGRPVSASEKSFYLPGFGSKIYIGAQCSKKATAGQTLCSDCCNHKSAYDTAGSKGHGTGKKAWFGVIGEAPPADAHLVGSAWAQKKYDTEFGLSPHSPFHFPSSKKNIIQKQPHLDIIESD
jgi:hypothetical protein